MRCLARAFLILFLLALSAGLSAAPIPFRGIVEGYYGRPWGTEGRLSLLKFMGAMKMNVFIYGPKDDPYHHTRWREPYPAAEMKDFSRLLACAKANKVNFYWAIHLGGGFRKGSAEDYTALFHKLELMYTAGMRGFAVFFDDFGGADANFHAEICNRIQKEFLDQKSDCVPLIMCPNVYWGTGHPYQRTLGAALDKRVHIMWTGRGICSDIRAEDVRQITADFQRPPYIWWNWPVNDYCRRHVLLGRTYGLDACPVAGFVSNPMENCEANKIALYGVAKWCLDPIGFDSVKSWNECFPKLYKNPVVAQAMRIFAEHNADQGPTVHRYRREESVAAAPLCQKATEELKANGKLTAATEREVRALFKEVGKASAALLKHLPQDKGLGWELQGWFEAEKYLMAQGLKALDILSSPTKAERAKALASLRSLRRAAEKAVDAHREKFAAATFSGDKGRIQAPDPSSRELAPLVNLLLETSLRRLYKARTGKDFAGIKGFAAFSSTASLQNLVVNREGKVAGIAEILEQRTVKAGESFGFSVPSQWETDYFHAKLGSPASVQAGVIELSKDGTVWTRLETKNKGENMESKLEVKDGWRYARYRNTSAHAVTIKLNQFKFDVRGDFSPVDGLLNALR